jgi:hypothetical protein
MFQREIQSRYDCATNFVDNLIVERTKEFHTFSNLQILEYLKRFIILAKKHDLKLSLTNQYFDSLAYNEAEKLYIQKKASIIQKAWKECNSNPTHSFCQNRLFREFIQLQKETYE